MADGADRILGNLNRELYSHPRYGEVYRKGGFACAVSSSSDGATGDVISINPDGSESVEMRIGFRVAEDRNQIVMEVHYSHDKARLGDLIPLIRAVWDGAESKDFPHVGWKY